MGFLRSLASLLFGGGARPAQGHPSQTQIDFANDSLARAIDWVKFADTKAGAVLVIVGLLLTNALGKASVLMRAYQDGGAQGDWATITFWCAMGGAVGTVAFATLVLYPHVKAKTSSLAFFGDIAGQTHQQFLNRLRTLQARSAAEEVAKQAWEVSRIAKQKFRWLRWAYGSAIVFLVLYGVSRLLLI